MFTIKGNPITTLKAYLVEPLAGTIRPVTLHAESCLAEIRHLIGCDMIDMVQMDDAHSIVVDDNGLKDGMPCFTQLQGHASPLAGNLMILGTSSDGDTVDVSVPVDDILKRLKIIRPVFHPVFETLNGPVVFGSRVSALEVRIDERRPTAIGLQ